MPYRRTRRYPEISPTISMDELSRKWSELIRELNSRDVEPVPPADVYGRNIGVGGNNFENTVFVTAGTSLPIAPTPAYWNVYEYQIPRDVGLVFVQPVPVSAAANIQIQTFLPLAQSVEGRTITIAGGNADGVSCGAFNLAVFPTSGSGDTLQLAFGGNIVSISNQVSGSSTLNVSTTTIFTDLSGNPVTGGYLMSPVIGSSLGNNYAVSVGTSTAEAKSNAISTSLRSTSNLTGSLNISVSSIGTLNPPLNYTFRAFGNKWIQIA